MPNWNAIYKRISMMEDSSAGPASVLNQVENEGKRISKWEVCRVVKELRKFRRYKFALEVYILFSSKKKNNKRNRMDDWNLFFIFI